MALVVLLRGVNVGGHRTFRPTTLAKQLKHLDAVNIGAAGTFVIRQPVTRARLRAELARRLPFDAEVMICQGREIVRLMSQNHFVDQPVRSDIVRFVSVLSKRPRSAPPTPMSFPSSRKWLLKILARDNRFVFGVYRRHMKVISYLGTFDRLFGVPVTTRNWNTITAIARVLNNGATLSTGHRRWELLPNNAFQRTHSRVTPLAEGRKRRATRRAAERERWASQQVGERTVALKPKTSEPKAEPGGVAQRAAAMAATHLIDERIRSLGGWRAETLAEVRRLIHEADPDIMEECKWIKASNPLGVPVWSHAGIVCTGEAYKQVVKLTFARGASLADPRGLFNSSLDGNTRRAIDIREGEVLDAGAFKALIQAAVVENLQSSARKSQGRGRA